MKISVVCAYPDHGNPGMISVDFAAKQLFERVGGSSVLFWNFSRPIELAFSQNNSICYQKLDDLSALDDSDAIVFWGDFIHWIGWAKQDLLWESEIFGAPIRSSELVDKWYKLFLLEKRPDLISRSIIFGTTLYLISPSELSDKRYAAALAELYNGSKLVMMRDAISTSIVSLVSRSTRVEIGLDPAFLLDQSSLNTYKDCTIQSMTNGIRSTSVVIGYAFGRSSSSKLLLSVLKSLLSFYPGSEELCIHWFDRSGQYSPEMLVNKVAQSTFIITDIYHCAVTALRNHIPVICFGHASQSPTGTLSDKKKEILFQQYGLGSYYYPIEKLWRDIVDDDHYESLVADIAQRLACHEELQGVHDMIDSRIQLCQARIHASLSTLKY